MGLSNCQPFELEVVRLTEQLELLPGDCIVAAGMVSYAGPFTLEPHRFKMQHNLLVYCQLLPSMQLEGLNTAQASSKNGSKSLTRNLSHTMRTVLKLQLWSFHEFSTITMFRISIIQW